MGIRIAGVVLALALVACGGGGGEQAAPTPTAAPTTAQVFGAAAFRSPKARAKVTNPVLVHMQATNIKIEKAGKVRPDRGHFHVMVDAKCVPDGEVIPEDRKHLHFGDGAKKARIKLKPGKHTLCLQVGDGAHRAFGNTDTVRFTVKK